MRYQILTNAMLVGASTFFALVLLFSLVIGVPQEFTLAIRVLLATLALSSLLFLKLPIRYRVRFVTVLASTGISLLVAESFLAIATPTVLEEAERYAEESGFPFDPRGILQTTLDLRATGMNVAPLTSQFRSDLQIGTEAVYPLNNGLANATVVGCNERGGVELHKLDEYGFNNPPGIWGKNPIKIAIVGDSFTYGQCVTAEKNFPSLIREVYENTLNLGQPGSGGLVQFATIKEYGFELEPGATLWVVFEGDVLCGFVNEFERSPVLRSYLQEGFRQNLLQKQSNIDQAIADFVESQISLIPQPAGWSDSLLDVLLFRDIRAKLSGLNPSSKPCVGRAARNSSGELCPPQDELVAIEQLIGSAKQIVNGWGGELYLVYLPSWTRFGASEDNCTNLREPNLSLADGLEIVVIDVSEAFSANPDPLSLFPYRVYGHYNEDGYRLVANTILESEDLQNQLGAGP